MPEPRSLSYVEALREASDLAMADDPSVFLFGLDVDDHLGIQGSTRGLLEKYGPERVFTTPLSEDAMTGLAIGAAMAGLRPIHVHIRMDFLLLCMNQLINVAAKARYMWGAQVSVPLVVRSMVGKSWGQGAQHSQGLHSLFMHVPGLKVVAPASAHDAKGCLLAAIADDNPVIFMEHRLLYPTVAPVPEGPYVVAPGKARICARGNDVTIVGISYMVQEAVRAAALLAKAGISAEIIDPVWLRPLDIDTIVASASRTGRLLVVDNGWTMCGASAEIVAAVVEQASETASIRVRRLGFANTTCPTSPWLEADFYPTPRSIAEAAAALVRPGEPLHLPELGPLDAVQFKGPF